MRAKLSLNLDDLMVDSFTTTSAQKAKGTVFGEQCTCPSACTCPGCPSCDPTCDGGNTCPYTCNHVSCEWTCDGHTCVPPTCDLAYCEMSQKETNCNHICY